MTVGVFEQWASEMAWYDARDIAVRKARKLNALGVHKQIANRLLEPFSWHKVIVTSTEWNGFMEQRCSPLAQPEIRAVAEEMANALFLSKPDEIAIGWHLPYIDEADLQWAAGASVDCSVAATENIYDAMDLLKMVSVARCARVSYLTHDGVRDPWADVKLFSRLISASPMHASPLEHVAAPCSCPEHVAREAHWKTEHGRSFVQRETVENYRPGHLGNFRGWDQLRHTIEQGVRA